MIWKVLFEPLKDLMKMPQLFINLIPNINEKPKMYSNVLKFW